MTLLSERVRPVGNGEAVPAAYLKGIIWLLLRMLCDEGELSVTDLELKAFIRKSMIVRLYSEVVPWISVTVQGLVCIPRGGKSCWSGLAEEKLPTLLANKRNLRPWDDNQPWSFEAWSIAAKVSSRFVAQLEVVPEEEFLSVVDDIWSSCHPSQRIWNTGQKKMQRRSNCDIQAIQNYGQTSLGARTSRKTKKC